MRLITCAESENLSRLIDDVGLDHVLMVLVQACYDRANQVYKYDKDLAAKWCIDAVKIEQTAATLKSVTEEESNMLKLKIEAIDYHRNGVAGNGFWVILFSEYRSAHKFVAIVFQELGNVAVLERDMLEDGNIRFRENSWRGDYYEPALREAIRQAEESM